MKGLLLLFYEPYVAGARDGEKTFNPDITEVKMIVNGIPNKVYSQGMKTKDMWEEVIGRFDRENSEMNATDFNARDKFGLFIDFRSIKAYLHGTTLSHATSLRQAYDTNCIV